jgi:hypothetical protein
MRVYMFGVSIEMLTSSRLVNWQSFTSNETLVCLANEYLTFRIDAVYKSAGDI